MVNLGGRNGGFVVAPLDDGDFTMRAWQMYTLLSHGFRTQKKQDSFSDFLLGCAAGGRRVFSFFDGLSVRQTGIFSSL